MTRGCVLGALSCVSLILTTSAQTINEFGESAYKEVYETFGGCGCKEKRYDFTGVVCGNNGQTYPSQCALQCHAKSIKTFTLSVHHKGRCQTCDCPNDVHIVCGENQQVFLNPCYAMCHGTVPRSAGYCGIDAPAEFGTK